MFENFTQNKNPFTLNWQNEFKKRDILSQIIAINLFIFLLITVSSIVLFLAGGKENFLVKFLSVPSSYAVLWQRPWGLFSYMFTHQGFFHLLFNMFNMLWLFWMGKLFIKYFNAQKLLWLYIAGGLGGAALYILAYNNLSVFAADTPYSYAIGASASVMAIFFAVAVYNPSYSIFLLFIGRVKMLHLAIGLVVIDLLMLPNSNPGGHISHLGGALVGVVFTLVMKQQLSLKSKKTTTQKQTYKHSQDYAYNAGKKQEEENINAILDKISKSGYESLSAKEREALFKSSYKK